MPLVLHSTSQCDVCLDSWSESDLPADKQPHAIACGHIYCLYCINRISPSICPLCRKAFVPNRVKKLHVSLPDPEQPDHAKELLEQIALVSGGRTERIVQVVEDATVWLSEQPENSNQPLRRALASLRDYHRLKDRHDQDKFERKRYKEQLLNRQRRHNMDIETSKAVENSLLEKLEEVEADFVAKLLEAESEITALRTEIARFRNTANPLPPPPQPIPVDMFPTLSSYQCANHRQYPTVPATNGRDTAADDENYVFVDQKHIPRRNRTSPVPPVAHDHQRQSPINHRVGIRPGAPPAQRVFPPRATDTAPPVGSYPSDGVGKQRENWYKNPTLSSRGLPVFAGESMVDSGIRMADGRDPFVTAQAFLSGYADGYGVASGYGETNGYREANGQPEATYPHGGYAPSYYDGHVSRYSHSPEEEEDEGNVSGLGLFGVPETAAQTGSVTRRSEIFRHNNTSPNDLNPHSNDIDPGVQHFPPSSAPPPVGSSHPLSDILGPDTSRRTEHRERSLQRRNRLNGSSRPDSMVSSWGTLVESVSTGSLESLEQVNNFQRVLVAGAGHGLQYRSEDENSRTPRVVSQNTPSYGQASQSSALGLHFRPTADVASQGSHNGRHPRHGRSSSMPITALDTYEIDNHHHQQRTSRADGDGPQSRVTSMQHYSDPQLEYTGPPSPTTTNALALTFDGPVDHSVNPHSRLENNGRSHIIAPTPIVRQNIIQSWQLGS